MSATPYVATLGLTASEIVAWCAERNFRIWDARQGGETYASIAKRERLTIGRVRQIILRKERQLRYVALHGDEE